MSTRRDAAGPDGCAQTPPWDRSDPIDHEATARARKALKLYHLITSRNVRGDASPAGLLSVIEAWTETEWSSASILTGTRPASEATRAVVLGMLRDDCEAA